MKLSDSADYIAPGFIIMCCIFTIAGLFTVAVTRYQHRNDPPCVEPANAPHSGSVTATFCR